MLDRARPDVVYVVTLPGQLLPIVRECLERGIHTSVEKSPGNTSADTAAMIEAEAASTAMAIVSFNRRYFPANPRRQAARRSPAAAPCTPPRPTTRTRAIAWSRT